MNPILDKICFLPPPAGTLWTGASLDNVGQTIDRIDGKSVEIDVPLFWHNPPWHRVSAETADVIATAVAELGVPVSALRSDLSGPNGEPHMQRTASQLPRIVPYRPERYGLVDMDFDGALVVDLRIAVNRDASGRFAYSPEQIERWEATPSSEPLAGGGWVAAATFPPDVVSLQHLSTKIDQLRTLSPSAAVFVSISPHRLQQELPAVVANKPDGLIVRMSDLDLDGLQLARLTRHARRLATATGAPELPIWIVPGKISPCDAVKLIELGASAVAIDEWGLSVIEAVEDELLRSTPGGYVAPIGENFVYQMIDEEIAPLVERTIGLLHSLHALPRDQRMASTAKDWGDALNLPRLDLADQD